MKSVLLFVLLLLSFSLTSQNLHVEGSAIIEGNVPMRVSTTGISVLNLRGNNPLIEIYDNSANYLAFLQVFGADLYLANVMNGRLRFRTNNTDRMTISSNGNVGIGTINPASKLTIDGPENDGTIAGLQVNSGSQKLIMDGNEIDCTSGGLHLNHNSGHDVLMRTSTRRGEFSFMHNSGNGGSNGLSIENPGPTNAYWTLYSTNSDGNLELYYKGAIRGDFISSSGAYTTVSDRRLKKNILPVSNVLDRVRELNPASYLYTNDPHERTQIGFVAQEVEPLFPELVHRGAVGDSEQEVYQLNYSGFGVIAIAAIQELTEENQLLKQQIRSMEERLSNLENK